MCIRNDGYMILSLYDNDERIYIYEHRLNALINNSLKDVLNNHVHHKNGCKLDNRVENLELMSPTEHRKLHRTGKRPGNFNPCIKITKKKNKTYKQGFQWGAQPFTKDKQIFLSSVDLDTCIKKVEDFINSEKNTYGYRSYEVIK